MWLLVSLLENLNRWAVALEAFERLRDGYNNIAQKMVEKDLGLA